MGTDSQIEAILFFKGEPVSIKRLGEILKKNEAEIKNGLHDLEDKLRGRGIVLMRKEDEVMLGTDPSLSGLIEEVTKEELMREIGKAGLETISIILYKSPITRKEIDYIRGVNSNFILRNLLIRGLIEKTSSPSDQRSFLYKPTFELMQYMGINKLNDLPEYEAIKKAIDDLESHDTDFESPQNSDRPASDQNNQDE